MTAGASSIIWKWLRTRSWLLQKTIDHPIISLKSFRKYPGPKRSRVAERIRILYATWVYQTFQISTCSVISSATKRRARKKPKSTALKPRKNRRSRLRTILATRKFLAICLLSLMKMASSNYNVESAERQSISSKTKVSSANSSPVPNTRNATTASSTYV